jgi:hypothetical protein
VFRIKTYNRGVVHSAERIPPVPTAQPDLARTRPGIPVTIAVLANDAGIGLTITGYTQPAAGTLVLNPDQSFTYTPGASGPGQDGFAYTVRDAQGATATGSVTITVERPNAVPVAADDAARVITGSSAVVAVLANDNDPDGDPLTVSALEAPGYGTVQIEPGQSVRYTPQSGFVGTDSFAYTVSDGRGGSATATVTVTVAAPNRAPVAQADLATTTIGRPVTIEALANDNDPDGDPLTLTGMTMPGHGNLSLNPDQSFVYAPDAGFTGKDSFTYTVRDPQGATATATVTVAVERANSPPVAAGDGATTPSGQAVTLNLLANDNDPDGDPLRLVALTMPLHGRLTANPDQSVTYTPDAGFTGKDSFTYRVSDGTAASEATAEVTVTPPSVATYTNGYRWRRRVMLPAQPVAAETADGFVLLVRETGAWLRGVANGGRIEHAAGFDLRFELADGTKLPHEVERYDGAAGELVAWVRIPGWRLTGRLELLLYYGKAGLAASEADPASTWRDYLAVWDPRTGRDRSGKGRDLAPANVADGSLIGPAGSFNGQAVATRADAGFLNGHEALTAQALVNADAAMVGSDRGILCQCAMGEAEFQAGLNLDLLSRTTSGVANTINFRVRCSDGGTFSLSAGGSHRTGPQLIHGVWRKGSLPELYLDGTLSPRSSTGAAVRSGTTQMASPGALYLGAGARDSATGGWRGLIDEVRLRSTALSAAWIATEQANLTAPAAFYGLGGEDEAGTADAAPVALPVAVTTRAGAAVDVDVLANSLDPDGGPQLTIAAVGAPAQGRTAIVGSVVRYTPVAGYVGTDRFTYTVTSGTRSSTGTVTVTVTVPPIQAVDDTATTTAGQAVTVAVLGNDTGTGLSLAAASDPSRGTVARNADNTLTYTPSAGFAGVDSFTYTATNGLASSTGKVTVTVRESAAVSPYRYAHKPPATLLPASDTDIVVWNVPAAGGTCPYVGEPSQVLLIAGPDAPLEGAILAEGLRFKAVFLIGATWRKKGATAATAPSGRSVKGGDYARIGFAAGLGLAPVLFVGNVDLDWHTSEPTVWGDFLATGSQGEPLELYVQKVFCRKGSYGFADAATGATASLSDFLQPKLGALGNLRFGDCDLRWGYQTIFCKNPSDIVPANARLLLQDVVFRANPSATDVHGGDGSYRQTVYVHAMGDLTGKVVNDEVVKGRYWAMFSRNVTAMAHPSFTASFAPYLVPGTTPAGAPVLASGEVQFPDYKSPGHADKPFNGNWRWNTEPSTPVVSTNEVGHPVRVTTAAKLREILTSDAGQLPDGLTAPKRQITVTSMAQLAAAIGGNFSGLTTVPAGATGPLQPGDHVILKDGVYASSSLLTVAASGTAADPIVIRAETAPRGTTAASATAARIRCPILVTGDHVTFWGLMQLDAPIYSGLGGRVAGSLITRANATRILRCWFLGTDFMAAQGYQLSFTPDARNGLVKHCTFEFDATNVKNPATLTGVQYFRGIGVDLQAGKANNAGLEIAWSLFKNLPGTDLNGWNIDYHDINTSAINVGGTINKNAGVVWGGRVHHCVLTGCGDNVDLSFRCDGGEVSYCTATNGKAGLRARCAQNLRFVGNWTDALGFQCYGNGHYYNGNVLAGNASILLFGGDRTLEAYLADTNAGSDQYCVSKDATLIGNKGKVVVGQDPTWGVDPARITEAARGVKLHQHMDAAGTAVSAMGTVVRAGLRYQAPSFSSSLPAGEAVATAVRLGEDQVGFRASWAD